MNGNHASTDEKALVPTRQQLAFSRQFTDDRAPRQAGALIIAILLGGILAWSLTAPIVDPVHTTAVVVLEADRETVTHPHGGIVSELLVRDGDSVERGQIVLRLDGADIEAQRQQVRRERRDALALQSRLLSTQQQVDPSTAEGEHTGATHRRQAELLAAKTAGLERQLSAQTRLKAFYEAERAELAAPAPITEEQQRALRDADRRLAEQDALLADLAARVASARLDQLAAESNEQQRTQAEGQLAQAALEGASRKLRLLDRQQRTLDDAMKSTIMRAPVAGRVEFSSTIDTGAEIVPGEPVFSIRPGDADLVATTKIPRIATLWVESGHLATLRLATGGAAERAHLSGRVSRVTPSTDDASQQLTIRIPAANQRPLPGGADLLPGRYPAEIVFDSGERALMRHLMGRTERLRTVETRASQFGKISR